MSHIQIKTFLCPVCNSPNLTKHLSDQLFISATCPSCGEHIEYDNTKALLRKVIGAEL